MRSTLQRCAGIVAAGALAATALAGGVSPAAASSPAPDRFDGKHKVVKKHLLVKKTAETSFTRTYKWTIDKTGDKTKVFVRKGKKARVNYAVKVGPDPARPYVDSDFKVEGKIFIKNPSWKHSAKITGVTDVVSPNIAATVDCGVTFPYRLKAGKWLKCSYSADLPNADKRINKATVTTAKWSKVKGAKAYAKVEFGDPTKTLDTCVVVADSKKGFLGKVCVGDPPKPFTYTLELAPYKPGANWFKNVAAFKTLDTRTVGADKWVVKVIAIGKPHRK